MSTKIKFQLNVARVLDVLAGEIYDTPYALLRENAQNAFDAILMRQYSSTSADFKPEVRIKLDEHTVQVEDNGIGMSARDLQDHFWRAGSSGKNTPEAIAAGVVGTFGIGGLANFGMSKRLTITSETIGGERTRSSAERDLLSVDKECITIESEPPTGNPGTTVLAELADGEKIDVKEASTYLRDFVKHVHVPVFLNGESISMKPLEDSVPPEPEAWGRTALNCGDQSRFASDLVVKVSESGTVWVRISKIVLGGAELEGELLLRQGAGQIMTFRSGFGLARTAVSSHYSFGGVADMKIFRPTAGRDSLTTESIQILQSIVSGMERLLGPILSDSPLVDLNTPFMYWVIETGSYDLCGNLKATLIPNYVRVELKDIAKRSQASPMNCYSGSDENIIKAVSSGEMPLIYLAKTHPRSACELGYLNRHAKINIVSDEPKILRPVPESSWSTQQAALAIRLTLILETDYFVNSRIQFADISHNLNFLIDERQKPIVITLSSDKSAITALLQCYETDFNAFGPFVKDFVRSTIFPRISHLVPSSTRQGAEAFLRMLRSQKETFEYDSESMKMLQDVIADFVGGKRNVSELVGRMINASQQQRQTVSAPDVLTASEVLPDVINYQRVLEASQESSEAFAAKPAVSRPDVTTDAKILVLDPSHTMFGFRAWLRLSDRAYSEKREFFSQPHSTEIIWGGQRVIFIFYHISRYYGFYYDIQLNEHLELPSGGERFETMTLALKDSVFIPIPDRLFGGFVPKGKEKKHFDVRFDILYAE